MMLGLCGGDTTFSSFSQRTLNLVWDGEWTQAAGIIALPVTPCLITVTAGHYAAAALNQMEAP